MQGTEHWTKKNDVRLFLWRKPPPAATPADIVQRLYTVTGNALKDPEMQQSLRAAGFAPSLLGPQDLGAFMRAEYEKWGRVVRETGATIN